MAQRRSSRSIAHGAELIVNLSASPFTLGKAAAARRNARRRSPREHHVPIVYCNAVGGNDELIFDGNSLVIGADGAVRAKLAPFREELAVVDTDRFSPVTWEFQSEPEELFDALCLGVRDYLHKCGFKSAVLGLSGGIDSAVTACIAAHALGPENVLGVTMPTQFSSEGSIGDSRDARPESRDPVPDKSRFRKASPRFRAQFREIFAGLPEDTTEENMQPRLRGMTLMALSNKFGHLLLSTGNKSELAVGYCTLYGDMCGGLAVISDVPKTMVYRLAEWINQDATANSSRARPSRNRRAPS